MTNKSTAKKKDKGIVIPMPASDPENREKQLINYAVNLAEKQLLEGTAAPSTINHFLKMASRRENIERDILERQAELISAKATAISKDKDVERIAREAIEAMKHYGKTEI